MSFAELGLAVALMSGITALLQTPVGYLVDHYGARRFLIGGALLMSLSMPAMGLATSFWQILLLALLSGIGNSVFHPADYAIISGSVDKERMGRVLRAAHVQRQSGIRLRPADDGAADRRHRLAQQPHAGRAVGRARGGRHRAAERHPEGPVADGGAAAAAKTSAAGLLLTRTMLLFFAFYLLGAMASAGVQVWLITVLHTVKGVELAVASAALTGFMVGATQGY